MPIESVDDGSLGRVVSAYLDARARKDAGRALSFLVPDLDAQTRDSERTFYQTAVARENLHRFRVLGVVPPNAGSEPYAVYSSVVVESDGACYDDVLTTHWTLVDGEWKLVPTTRSRFMAIERVPKTARH